MRKFIEAFDGKGGCCQYICISMTDGKASAWCSLFLLLGTFWLTIREKIEELVQNMIDNFKKLSSNMTKVE